MLSEVIGRNDCELPISRIGDGHYMFGSKKIYAKIIANKLVVRVGGGYMNMDEFISTYAESERLKLERLDPAYIESLHKSGEDRHNINAVPLYGRSGSPKYGARSPKAAAAAGGGSPKNGEFAVANGALLRKSIALGSPRASTRASGTTAGTGLQRQGSASKF